MTIPAPRTPGDDAHHERHHREREAFLTAFATLYDHLREGSRAHLMHAVDMAARELGGLVWVQLPCRPTRRSLPEAGYVSEQPSSVRIG